MTGDTVADCPAAVKASSTAEDTGMCNASVARFAFSGRKPDVRTVGGVLEEEPLPIKAFRRFLPYHETPDAKERRP
jgi:hypothetical protein